MLSKAFFAVIAKGLFNGHLSQLQVNTLNTISGRWDAHGNGNLNDFSYLLATIYNEASADLQPKSENLNYTAKRMREVWPSKFKTIAAAKPYAGNPEKLANRVYAGILDNGDEASGDGWRFRGRGYQVTGRKHYTYFGQRLGVDLVGNPDLMNIVETAADSLIIGMVEGRFTGTSFTTYIDAKDEPDSEDMREFVNARRIVNGSFNAVPISHWAIEFEHALRAL